MARTSVFILFLVTATTVVFAADKKEAAARFDKVLKGTKKTDKVPPVTIMPAHGDTTGTAFSTGTVWVPRGPANRPVDPSRITAMAKKPVPVKSPGIVFLVDTSSSMIGYWKRVQSDVIKYIGRLDESTNAEVIIFSDGKPVSTSGKLAAADEAWKKKAVKLITEAQPAGNTDPETALKAAINVTGSIEGSAVYFISDGVFADFGQSAMDLLRKKSEGRKCHVHALLFGDPVIDSIVSMRRIASAGSGIFRNVTGRR